MSEQPVGHGTGENGKDLGDGRWMIVEHLPEVAKGYTWFKRFGHVGDVRNATFRGLKPGQMRWVVCECASADEAQKLVKELDGQNCGGEHPVSARVISEKERAEYGKEWGERPDRKEREKDERPRGPRVNRSRDRSRDRSRSRNRSRRSRRRSRSRRSKSRRSPSRRCRRGRRRRPRRVHVRSPRRRRR